MLATYGIDVLDPRVSYRRLGVLVARLPADARPSADPMHAWSTEAHLLANVFDALQGLIWVTKKVANPKANPSKPKPLPRPGRRAPAGRARTPAEPRTDSVSSSGWAGLLRSLQRTPGVKHG